MSEYFMYWCPECDESMFRETEEDIFCDDCKVKMNRSETELRRPPIVFE